MKYNPKIYAQVLVALIKDKEEGIPEKFFALLRKNGDLKKAKEIIALAEKITLKEAGGRKIVIEGARKGALKNAVKGLANGQDIVKEKINPALVAGIKITVDDEKQLDYSFKHTLDIIFTHVTGNH